jgi:hypothetical protein
MPEGEEWNHVAYVEAWTCGVTSYIKGDRTFVHKGRKAVNICALLEKTS